MQGSTPERFTASDHGSEAASQFIGWRIAADQPRSGRSPCWRTGSEHVAATKVVAIQGRRFCQARRLVSHSNARHPAAISA